MGGLVRLTRLALWFPRLAPAARLLLRGLATHPHASTRDEVAQCLGAIGNRGDYRCLLAMVDDPDPVASSGAAENLFVVGERLAVPVYRRVLTSDYDELTQMYAVIGVSRLDPTGRLDPLFDEVVGHPMLSDLAAAEIVMVRWLWFGEERLSSVLAMLEHPYFPCALKPVWFLEQEPRAFDALSAAGQLRVLEALEAFADADPGRPAWQRDRARSLHAKLAPLTP